MNLLGQGILKGMSVTLKNFALSYFDRGRKERLPTVQYPEEGNTVTLFSRNFPFLIYDGDDSIDGMRCVGCQICERECPPACIYIVKELDENGKFIKRAKVFDIDISVCMGCQICVEVCPFDAIEMDSEFELSNVNRFEGLMVNREQLLKSNDYYHKIHPDGARDRDANLAAKKAEEEAKKKAREAKMAEAKAKKEAEAKAKAEAPEISEGEGAKAEASGTDEKPEASAEPPVAKDSPADKAETSTEKPVAEVAEDKPAVEDNHAEEPSEEKSAEEASEETKPAEDNSAEETPAKE